ncbi:hypothetical protein D9Q98_006248 [Chlorella vulgaris]|uniref:SSD domain-containing protein n=1 Tax=Chlorella vulgaris TaxID=3077 RepID=A0A9D4TX82_CHLVU|nr:hypothetical protein D9Q98_006248 [Chlorella vulgaris]
MGVTAGALSPQAATRWLLAAILILLVGPRWCQADEDSWRTRNHEPGYCATHGICGHRADGDPLSCANNTAAQPLNSTALQKLQVVCPQLAAEFPDSSFCCTEEQLDQLQSQIQVASIFLVGCPACNHNFKHFFCLLTCSPNQASFVNVTAAQTAPDTNASNAIAEADYFLAAAFGERFYSSCSDVVYPAANQRAMAFVGGGATNYSQWFEFLGTIKDKRFPPTGAPFQMNFPPQQHTPEAMSALNSTMHSCGEGALACSCGDCPSAPGCEPPPPPPPPPPPGCPAAGTSSLTCIDLSLALVYAGLLACLPLVVSQLRRQQQQGREWQREHAGAAAAAEAGYADGTEPLLAGRRAAGDGKGQERGEQEETGGEEEEDDLIQWPVAEQLLRRQLYRLGRWCAGRPLLTLTLTLLLVGGCAGGLTRLRVMTDPQELWVGPGSQAAQEKAAFEVSFGPFYRITQLILTTTPAANSSFTSPSGLPAIVTDANIRLLFDLQDEIDSLTASYDAPENGVVGGAEGGGGGGSWNVTLADVCLRPLGTGCATQSVLQYWGMSREVFEHGPPSMPIRISPEFCFTHWSTQCRSAFGGPVDPHLVLGGFPTAAASLRNFSADATAFVVTLPINPHPDNRPAALAWEAAFVELAGGRLSEMAAAAGLRLSFSAERSVQDELARESMADVPTVLLSYFVMLLYIAVGLARFPRGASWRDMLVHSRAALGLGGVLIVAAAVLGSMGLCAWGGMRSTLIIAEVIPFLVLAVGVDNMFILAAALQQQRPEHPLPHRMGLALAAVGPSITLAASCEVVAFAVGAMTSMPALRNFSICAALAVLLDYLLQVTAFVALLALDTHRLEQGRYDCWPCLRAQGQPLYESDYEEQYGTGTGTGAHAPAAAATRGGGGGAPSSAAALGVEVDEIEEEVEAEYGHSYSYSRRGAHAGDDAAYCGIAPALRRYMRQVHAPLLARPWVKAAVLALFGGLFLLSCALLPRLERGMDQSVALPQDSYLQAYYADVFDSLRVGPPVMFVVGGLNVSAASPHVSRVCSVAGCDPDSLLNQVAAAARTPWSSWLATPAASWLDDFITWASPEIPQCCRSFPNATRCPPPDQPPCDGDPAACAACATCFAPGQLPGARPDLTQFQNKLPWFLAALPSAACAKGGAGAYAGTLQLNASDPTGVAGLGASGLVAASHFRSNYVTLSRQSDFIHALEAVRAFAADASTRLDLPIYPYSPFHIFFEQYTTIGGEALTLLGSACVAIFLICLGATGSPWSATLIVCTLVMVVVDVMGFMALAHIQLNAVSLVNLVMCLGIGVEFCAHLVHAFVEESGSSEQRAAAALRDVGAAVLSGITLTKVAGVSVLALSHTAIFRVYYFQMYAALVLLGAAHGLVLLPVLLAAFGPEELEHWKWRVHQQLERLQSQRLEAQQRVVSLMQQQQQQQEQGREGGQEAPQQALAQPPVQQQVEQAGSGAGS